MQDDFWDLEDKSESLPTNGTFDMGGGDFDPLPAKTQVLAALEELKWNDYEGEITIQGKWAVLAPDEYKNRKIFQKIRIEDSDTKKRDKAKRMLAAIDANAGGKLITFGRKPTNEDLALNLCNKPMMLLLGVWEQNDKRGNWVMQVAPKGTPKQPKPQRQESQSQGVDFGDDIPF